MKIPEIKSINFDNPTGKCRICFTVFKGKEKRFIITKISQKKFENIAGIELILNRSDVPKSICSYCDTQLKKVSLYIKNISEIQKKFYKTFNIGFNLTSSKVESSKKSFEPPSNNLLDSTPPEDIVIKCEAFDLGYGDIKNEENLSNSFLFDSSTFLQFYKQEKEKNEVMEDDGNDFDPFGDDQKVDLDHLKDFEAIKPSDDFNEPLNATNFMDDQQDSDSDWFNDDPVNDEMAKDEIDKVKKEKLPAKSKKGKKMKNNKEKFEAGNEKLICDVCGIEKSNPKALSLHMLSQHPNDGDKFQCPVEGCQKNFSCKIYLNRHMINHQGKQVVCPHCGKVRANKRSLEAHILRIHKKDKRYSCDHCDYKTSEKYSILIHIRNRHFKNTRIYYCQHEGCNFSSYSKSSVATHNRKDHIGRIFECHCGKSYHNKQSLKYHIEQVHDGIRAHQCPQCEKAYFDKKTLNNHIKSTHIKTRDVPCKICGKLFTTRVNLSHHIKKRHTAPTHACTFEGCEKVFHELHQLKTHQKVHLDVREFQCHLCEKNYFSSNNLKIHLDVVHGQTTYFCELCDYTNNRRDYMKNHLKNAHKLNEEEMKVILGRVKVVKINV